MRILRTLFVCLAQDDVDELFVRSAQDEADKLLKRPLELDLVIDLVGL